jgi:hypothetical protein
MLFLFFYDYVRLDFFPKPQYTKNTTERDLMLKAEIYEMEYSVSPGGIDCWEITIQHYGSSENYGEFKTAGDAVNYLISRYPGREIQVDITTLSAYNILMERENA